MAQGPESTAGGQDDRTLRLKFCHFSKIQICCQYCKEEKIKTMIRKKRTHGDLFTCHLNK